MLRADAAPFWARLDATTTPDDEGGTTVCRVVVSDVTEAKRAEEALRASETRFAITDSAHDAILMMNSSGVISYRNSAAESILGYRKRRSDRTKSSHSAAPQPLLRSPSRGIPRVRPQGRGKAVGKTIDRGPAKGRPEVTVDLSLSAVTLNGEWHAVGVLRDISERKAHEREIQRLNRLYAALSELNQIIGCVTSREELFREVCRITTGKGRIPACVDRLVPSRKRIRVSQCVRWV